MSGKDQPKKFSIGKDWIRKFSKEDLEDEPTVIGVTSDVETKVFSAKFEVDKSDLEDE